MQQTLLLAAHAVCFSAQASSSSNTKHALVLQALHTIKCDMGSLCRVSHAVLTHAESKEEGVGETKGKAVVAY